MNYRNGGVKLKRNRKGHSPKGIPKPHYQNEVWGFLFSRLLVMVGEEAFNSWYFILALFVNGVEILT